MIDETYKQTLAKTQHELELADKALESLLELHDSFTSVISRDYLHENIRIAVATVTAIRSYLQSLVDEGQYWIDNPESTFNSEPPRS